MECEQDTPEKEIISFENNEFIENIIIKFVEKNTEFLKKNGTPNYSSTVRALIIRGGKYEGLIK